MADILTRKRQAQAEARERASTKEPWLTRKTGFNFLHQWEGRIGKDVAEVYREEDVAFVAHVRTDAPLAYETIRQMEEVVRWAAAQCCENPELLPKCAECGRSEDNPKHAKYGPDRDDPVKHDFVAKRGRNCGQCQPCRARQVMKEREA